MSGTTVDILIVGAGAAGIAAARRLAGSGLSTLVVEAGRSVGGRARTDNTTFGVPFDLGCHFLHSPGRNPLKAHADALGIRYLADGLPTRHLRRGAMLDAAEEAACAAYVAACHARIEAAGSDPRDRPAAALFDGGDPWHPAFELEFLAKQGVPAQRGSAWDFARYVWEGPDLPVVGGLGNLVAGLAEGLPVSLDTPVLGVDLRPADAIRVDTPRGPIAARAVILTVSTGVLGGGAIRFVPDLPDWKRVAIEALPMGSCNKAAVSFRRPIGDPGRGCLLLPIDRAGEAVEIILQPDGAAMAVGMFNGPFGRDIAAQGLPAMADYILSCLAGLFGGAVRDAAGPARAMVDWDREPFVRGYVSAAVPGGADARRALARPVDDRLFFAGEATEPSFMGDVHGAWLSGIDAADAAAGALRGP